MDLPRLFNEWKQANATEAKVLDEEDDLQLRRKAVANRVKAWDNLKDALNKIHGIPLNKGDVLLQEYELGIKSGKDTLEKLIYSKKQVKPIKAPKMKQPKVDNAMLTKMARRK